jgi:hypothetical protein
MLIPLIISLKVLPVSCTVIVLHPRIKKGKGLTKQRGIAADQAKRKALQKVFILPGQILK